MCVWLARVLNEGKGRMFLKPFSATTFNSQWVYLLWKQHQYRLLEWQDSVGSEMWTTVSSTRGITRLKKTGGVKGAQKLFLIFSSRCWTCATLRPSLGDPSRLVNFLPSSSCQTLPNSVWTVGEHFAAHARGVPCTLGPSFSLAFSHWTTVNYLRPMTAGVLRVSAACALSCCSSSCSPLQNSSPGTHAPGFVM